MRQAYRKCEKGFTLVELLVTLIALSIILISLPLTFRGGTQVWQKGDRHAEVIQNALIGMEELTRELRQSSYIIDVSGSDETNGFIEFQDKDSNVLRYQYDSATSDYLQRGAPDDLHSLAGPLASLEFKCYDEGGNWDEEKNTVEDIRSVQIQMFTADSKGAISPVPLSSRVYIRDLIIPGYDSSSAPEEEEEEEGNGGGPDEFAIFGHSGVYLKNGVTVTGSIGTQGNVGSNGSIYLRNHVDIDGDVIHLGNFDVQNDKQIDYGSSWNRSEIGYIEAPPVTDFSSFSPDDDIPEAGKGEPLTIPPGEYPGLDLKSKAVVNLTSGIYYFESITADNNFKMNIDLSGGGDIRIFVAGPISIKNGFIMEVEGGGPEDIYIETHSDSQPAVDIGSNSVLLGTIYATEGDIGNSNSTIDSSVMYGALYSMGTVYIHNGSEIHYVRSNYLYPQP